MERSHAGEGFSSSTHTSQQVELASRSDREARCAYARLVAQELAQLRAGAIDSPERETLHARVRRWWSWPSRDEPLPAGSRV